MKILKKCSLVVAVVFAWLSLSLAPLAYAQNTDTQQLIDNGLCSGSNLQLSGGDCSQTQQGVQKFNDFVRKGINILSAIVGVISVVMIIVGGLRYVTSGGSDTSVTSAKNTILYAVIGLVIVAMAQVIVHFVLKQIA